MAGDNTSTTIVINGCPAATTAATLAALLEEQGYGKTKVATALNGSFVPARARERTPLSAGDRVEIVSVRQGG